MAEWPDRRIVDTTGAQTPWLRQVSMEALCHRGARQSRGNLRACAADVPERLGLDERTVQPEVGDELGGNPALQGLTEEVEALSRVPAEDVTDSDVQEE